MPALALAGAIAPRLENPPRPPGGGTAIIDARSGRRSLVTWPVGWTARRSPFGVSVCDSRGQVVARTGTYVNPSGGNWSDGSFLACAVS